MFLGCGSGFDKIEVFLKFIVNLFYLVDVGLYYVLSIKERG